MRRFQKTEDSRNPGRQRHNPVNRHQRTTTHHGLHRNRAGSGRGQIGPCQQIARVSGLPAHLDAGREAPENRVELLPALPSGGCSGKAHARPALLEPRGRARDRRADAPYFRTARTRKQGHKQISLAGGRQGANPFRRLLIGNRMTDEHRFHAFIAQQSRFERKQAQHPVAIAADAPRPAGAPGPYRGADVLHGVHATPLQAPGQAQVEFRRIHADENVRAILAELPEQPAAQHPQARQVANNFGQAHDREFRRIKHGLAPRLAHCGASNAGHFHLDRPGAQGANQPRAQAIAGGLAGDHRDPQGPIGRRQRKRPRPDSARNSVIGVNSGCSRAASAMIPVASARLSSLR